MSLKKVGNHLFHGDAQRFEEIAHFVGMHFGKSIKRIADVGGGQGMLARMLKKKFNFEVDVIDPRGYTMVGVNSRKEEYKADMATFYDLIIGLHPDNALREVVESAKMRPILVLPCCNFWDKDKTLGRDALLKEIEDYFDKEHIIYERVIFGFKGPKNIGLITTQNIQ